MLFRTTANSIYQGHIINGNGAGHSFRNYYFQDYLKHIFKNHVFKKKYQNNYFKKYYIYYMCYVIKIVNENFE